VQAPADRKDLFLAPYYGWLVEALLQNLKGDVDEGEAASSLCSKRPRTRFDSGSRFLDQPRCARGNEKPGQLRGGRHQRWNSRGLFPRYPRGRNRLREERRPRPWHPYLHNGEQHEYVPDFRRSAEKRRGTLSLLETKGYDPLKEIKKAAAERWCAAVNTHGGFGNWTYRVVDQPEKVSGVLSICAQGAVHRRSWLGSTGTSAFHDGSKSPTAESVSRRCLPVKPSASALCP